MGRIWIDIIEDEIIGEMRSVGDLRKRFCPLEWVAAWALLAGLANSGRAAVRVPSFARNVLFSEPSKPVPGPEKNYTGIRARPDSILLLYHHEQTIAVVEVAPTRALFNCELLEVRTKADRQAALNALKPAVPTQMRIAFADMMDLMVQCQKLDPPLTGGWAAREGGGQRAGSASGAGPRQFTSLFSGVFPGTKWCGAGDIAISYHDLGPDKELDKCCRTHDLCPVKVAGFRTQYNLTNYSLYTKSHCTCDEHFYDCLKSVGTATSNFLGSVYFNVAPVTCVEDVPGEKKRFSVKSKRF